MRQRLPGKPLLARCERRRYSPVGNVHHLLVPGNLGDEVSGVGQVDGDGHPDAQRAHVVVLAEELLDHGLGVGVEAAAEVGTVLLLEADAATWKAGAGISVKVGQGSKVR
jgi:hypothetical protein